MVPSRPEAGRYLADLVEKLARNRVVILAGTGVSIAATRSDRHPAGHPQASWPGLLEHGLNFLIERGLATEQILAPQRLSIRTGDPDNLISAAQVISRKMGAPMSDHYRQWLAQALGGIRPQDTRLLSPLHRLRTAGNIIATTNYDDILLADQPELRPITWKDGFELIRVARGEGSAGVLFLHGHWQRPETVVLDWRSYLELVEDEASSHVEAIWKLTTWLYVGCGQGGLSDPDLGKLIEHFGPSARRSDLWDYFLAKEGDTSVLELFFTQRAANIRVLSYGERHEDLPAFLERLAENACRPVPGTHRRPSPLVEFTPITAGFRDFRQPGEDVFVSFRPSLAEFKLGLVHRPRTVDTVLAALDTLGWAWLRGVSATGKSTMALHVAVETSTPALPALYLDLSDEPDVVTACDEVRSFAEAGRLFIIDNVHVSPRTAATLLRHWEEDPRGSRMLLLGWPVDETTERRHLVAYRSCAVDVLPTEDDLAGIYVTLRRRLRPDEASVPLPQPETLRDWFQRFGADLVAFQIAVAAMLRLPGTSWLLEEEAAERYLREKYLDDCTLEERSSLVRLALFSELGFAVPDDCVVGPLGRSLAVGIVRKSTHGPFGRFVRFRLWHQALARCLLAASRERVDRAGEFSHASVANPFFGSELSYRLWQAGEKELACRVLRSGLSSPGGLLGLFGDNLRLAVIQLDHLNATGVLSLGEAASALTASPVLERLKQKALATPLHFLGHLLRFVARQRELHTLYESLAAALATEAQQPAAENRLQTLALATPLAHLLAFLRFVANQVALRTVYDAIATALVVEARKPASESRLLPQALATPLGLSSFLGFAAARPELTPVYDAIATALVVEARKPASESRLLRQALATPLENLSSFLGFAAKQERLLPMYELLVDSLVAEARKPAPENRLLARALVTSPEHLAAFFRVCAENPALDTMSTTLGTLLSQHATAVAKMMLQARFAQNAPLLSVAPKLATAALETITDDVWNKALGRMGEAPVNAFGAFVSRLATLGFPDKAAATATVLVRRAQLGDWANRVIGIIDLSMALRHATVGGNEKQQFLDAVASPGWLTFRYYNHQLSHLAGGLFHLLAHQPPSVVQCFLMPALKTRVGRELLRLRDLPPLEAGHLLQLWAAADLLGAEIFVNKVHWPAPGLVSELLTVHFAHPSSVEGMGYIQQQLWMGIRLLVGHHPSPIPVDTALVEDALARWRRTAGEVDRTAARAGWDEGMIPWLERSRGSVFARDRTPLRLALARPG